MKKLYLFFVMTLASLTLLTACEDGDDYIAQQLRNGDWQGYIGTYYTSRWNISGTEYATVMQFTSAGAYYTSGRGRELDYNTYSPHRDYAYCTFKWFIVDGEITLIYDDSKWQPIYISRYSLSPSRFSGRINDGTGRNIQFDLENTAYSDWGYYGTAGGYGDFSNQNYFYSRQTRTDAPGDTIPFIDRTPLLPATDDGSQPQCVMSGIFAEAYENMR